MQYSTREGYPHAKFSPAPQKRRSTGRGRQGRLCPARFLCASAPLAPRLEQPARVRVLARVGAAGGPPSPYIYVREGRFATGCPCCRFPLGLQQGRLFPYVVSLYCSPVSSFTYCIPDPSGCVQSIASFPVSVSPFSNFAPFALLQLALIQLG